MLHVAHISFYLDPQGRDPERILREWPSLVDVAESVAGMGVRVSVVQACALSACVRHHAIEYHFVEPDEGGVRISRTNRFLRLIETLSADVFHVHGLCFPRDVLALARAAPRTPILLQDHANRPPHLFQRHLWRRALCAASGIAFCALAQAQPFMDSGLLRERTRIYEIPESSSRFAPGDVGDARRVTGLYGDPCVLWVGHFDDNKDPLTVLRAISTAAARLPGLQLWCCFGSAPLLGRVREFMECNPALRERVHLLGSVPHSQIELLMRAADFFVLGSHREGSGYSLIEALACGLPPVVTDIPSFCALTGRGAVGRLWMPGNAQALEQALLAISSGQRVPLRAATRAHFERELSFRSVGMKLTAAYEDVLRRVCCKADHR